MNKWLRRGLIALALLAVAGAGGYYWLFMANGTPAGSYALDIGAIRKLADRLPGAKPREIRVEQLSASTFPATAIVAGDGWNGSPIGMFSYQIVFPDRSIVVDTGFDPKVANANGIRIDPAAYARLAKVLNAPGTTLYVTHEHVDHLGGFLAQRNARALLARTVLNREQVANAARYNEGMPAHLFDGYKPLAYDTYRAIAPGVVLIRAAGHTPGSQMVYVRTAAGKEYLFIGDVAWRLRNIALVRGRAWLVSSSLMLGEDRGAVQAQLAALHALNDRGLGISFIPGHDRDVVDADIVAGTLQKGFR